MDFVLPAISKKMGGQATREMQPIDTPWIRNVASIGVGHSYGNYKKLVGIHFTSFAIDRNPTFTINTINQNILLSPFLT